MMLAMTIQIELIEGPPGSKKTRTMVDELLLAPSRYLLACPRIDLMHELHAYALSRSSELNVSCPDLRLVSSERRGGVSRQMTDAARDLSTSRHAVVLCTHEALKASDLAPFDGWNVRLDEVPDGVASGSLLVPATSALLDELLPLEPIVDTTYAVVRQGSHLPSRHAVQQDNLLQPLTELHKHARGSAPVVVDVRSWADAQGRGRRVGWWCAWTPLALVNFASITIASASFDTSLCARITRICHPDLVTLRHRRLTITRAPRQIRIGYFTDAHEGTTDFWSTSDGRRALHEIARYLDRIGGVGFWSGNEVVRTYLEHRFGGILVKPKLAGTNSLIEHGSCAMIYSNKAQSGDEPLLDVFGINRDIIRQSREDEDIYQFVLRGALRDQNFAEVYRIYLYSRAQAERLAERLRNEKIGSNIELEPIAEARLLALSPERPRRARTIVDGRTQAEREEAKRRDARHRQTLCRQRRRERNAVA